ncbi:hypothetical protein ACUVZD_000109 [Pseudomonas aeruginosa]
MKVRAGLAFAIAWLWPLIAIAAPVGEGAGLPGLHVMLISTEVNAAETDAALALHSTAGEDSAFLFPVEQSSPESLMAALGSTHPSIFAERTLPPSREANTALEAYIGGEGVLIRTKTTSIQGDRVKVWVGVQVSSAGAGPAKPISRTSFPAEIANGEAFLARVNAKMLVAVTPEPFTPTVALPGELQTAQQPDAPIAPSASAASSEPRIIWDTAPGAAVPDDEALQRILQQP